MHHSLTMPLSLTMQVRDLAHFSHHSLLARLPSIVCLDHVRHPCADDTQTASLVCVWTMSRAMTVIHVLMTPKPFSWLPPLSVFLGACNKSPVLLFNNPFASSQDRVVSTDCCCTSLDFPEQGFEPDSTVWHTCLHSAVRLLQVCPLQQFTC